MVLLFDIGVNYAPSVTTGGESLFSFSPTKLLLCVYNTDDFCIFFYGNVLPIKKHRSVCPYDVVQAKFSLCGRQADIAGIQLATGRLSVGRAIPYYDRRQREPDVCTIDVYR